jgi:hypothetical protein
MIFTSRPDFSEYSVDILTTSSCIAEVCCVKIFGASIEIYIEEIPLDSAVDKILARLEGRR